MSKKINEMLDVLNQAVDDLSSDELVKILSASGVSSEIANNYAYLETFVISYNDYENACLKTNSSAESDDIALAA